MLGGVQASPMVEAHVTVIVRKLGVGSRTQAVIEARNPGFAGIGGCDGSSGIRAGLNFKTQRLTIPQLASGPRAASESSRSR